MYVGLDGDEAYSRSLQLLYGEATLNLALDLLNGEQRFFGFSALGADFEGSAAHRQLLAAYAKVQACKAG